jgi:two-component system OmpR family sensor kinase
MSLRARLLAGVLVMTAVGLLAAGGGTYLALRSFLLGRVDQQLDAARAAVGRGLRQSSTSTIGTATLDRVAPPIAFVEVRDDAGRVVAVHAASSISGSSPEPRLPARLHPPPPSRGGVPSRERSLQFDVPAVRGAGRYRVLVSSLPASDGVLIVAVSLDDVDATLRHLVPVELLIAAGLLAVLAFATFWLLRRGLRPLERISEVAGGIAQGDLDVRVSPAEDRSEIGRLGMALNGMLERLEDAFARRDRSEAQLRRFVASASHRIAHAADVDPWLRGAAAPWRQARSGGSRDFDRPDRVRGDADGRVGRRSAAARSPG